MRPIDNIPTRQDILDALRNFPGGAQARAVNHELGITRAIHRGCVNTQLSKLAKEGRIHRTGEKGSYLYLHPDNYTPDPAAPRASERKLERNHPAVAAAREAAGYLRPDLARRLTQLADWATGERAR